ncbi:MAG TPA: hypothetical protein VH370_00200 [Humisphaera sp.]|nr:hypothetical protein [Humisphaera sp.]
MRNELEGVGSMLPQVAERIDAVSMKPASRRVAWSLAACLAISAAGALFGWRFFHPSSQPSRELAVANVEQDLTLKVGDDELFEHFTAILDHRFVVVIWSYRGNGITATPASAGEIQTGRYRLATLHEARLADGRTFVCSLLVPDDDAKVILEPPSIYARSADHGIIACSVSPRAATREELANAIRSAGVNGKEEIGVEDILRRIREQIH